MFSLITLVDVLIADQVTDAVDKWKYSDVYFSTEEEEGSCQKPIVNDYVLVRLEKVLNISWVWF